MTATANAINATLYPNLNFNFISDIAPVASIGRTPVVMAINPSLPAKTLPDFIAYAKVNPGKINFASSGNGTPLHLAGELFKMMSGVELVHVPYHNSYMPDLLGDSPLKKETLLFEPKAERTTRDLPAKWKTKLGETVQVGSLAVVFGDVY